MSFNFHKINTHLIFRGSRFWSFDKARALASRLEPLIKKVMNSMTTDSLIDWATCVSAATNKQDPNRIRWIFDLFLQDENTFEQQGSYKQSTVLKLLNNSLQLNWKLLPLYKQTYEMIKRHWDHPYQKVRFHVSKIMSTLTVMDVNYRPDSSSEIRVHCGDGFPTRKQFLDDILPRCKINVHNPELNGVVALNGAEAAATDTTSTDSARGESEMEQEEEKPTNGKAKTTTPAKRSTRSSGAAGASVAASTPTPALERRRSLRGKSKKVVDDEDEDMEVAREESSMNSSIGSGLNDSQVSQGSTADNDTTTNTSVASLETPDSKPESDKLLHTMSSWLMYDISTTAATMTSDFYRTLPYLCQYCLLYTSPSPRDRQKSRMPSSA